MRLVRNPASRRVLLRSVPLGLAVAVLSTSPASAHAAGGGEGSGVATPRAIAVALGFVALAVVSGSALTGEAPGRWRDGLSRIAAVAAVLLAPSIGLRWAALVLAFGAAGAAAAGPARSRWRVGATALLLAIVVGGAKGAVDWWGRGIGTVHVVAAASWVGLVVEVALAWRAGGAAATRAARRASVPALGLLVVVAASGSIDAADHLGDAQLALGTGWGRSLAVKVVLVAVAATLGATVHRRWAPRTETSLLGVVAAIGLGLALVGGPLSGAAPLGPLLATSPEGHSVLVAPLLPGGNAVLVRGAASGPPVVRVDGRAVPLARTGAGAWFGRVDLRAGRHRVQVDDGAPSRLTIRRADVATTVRAEVPDDADAGCLDRVAGAAAAVAHANVRRATTRLEVVPGARTCRVDGVEVASAPWAEVVAAALDGLRARGSTGAPLVLVGGDPRGWELATALTAGDGSVSAVPIGSLPSPLAAGRVVVVATDRRDAVAAAQEAVAASGGLTPVVLAPWLLDAGVVSDVAARKLPVLVAAPRDPTSGLAVSYRLSAATAAGGGVPITADGFEGYLAVAARLAGDRVPAATPGVFSMSRVSILPADLERGHESESGWARGVALVRVLR